MSKMRRHSFSSRLIYSYTDFSQRDFYISLMHSAILKHCPQASIMTLHAEAPQKKPRAAAYLLAAMVPYLMPESVILAVVDPGVGTDRRALVLDADNRYWVGPDNGLLALIAKKAHSVQAYQIKIEAPLASNTFHGRDLFAPVAAQLACGQIPARHSISLSSLVGWDWPEQLNELIYIDAFGNLIFACSPALPFKVRFKNRPIQFASTFADVPIGALFCYINSIGLLEIAANQASAAQIMQAKIGDPVYLE